ncbi:MAG: hypothetical protein JSV32_07905 [Dehalococcoidia bacterium]|nr:MAG: hypothetical protein JSV32_07905 [Dehalococcoidia bacterium]
MNSLKKSSEVAKSSIARLIILGIIGGLVGMIVMDLVMVAEFLIMELPMYTYLELIGSVFGGGVTLGVITHILLSIFLGLIFLALVFNIGFFRITTIRSGFILGFLFGVVTIIGCVPFAIITGIPIVEILSFSTLPHLIFGASCGLVVGYGLRK